MGGITQIWGQVPGPPTHARGQMALSMARVPMFSTLSSRIFSSKPSKESCADQVGHRCRWWSLRGVDQLTVRFHLI